MEVALFVMLGMLARAQPCGLWCMVGCLSGLLVGARSHHGSCIGGPTCARCSILQLYSLRQGVVQYASGAVVLCNMYCSQWFWGVSNVDVLSAAVTEQAAN